MKAAVKVVDRAKLTPEDDEALKDEVAILRDLKHDHIVRLFDFYQARFLFVVVFGFGFGFEGTGWRVVGGAWCLSLCVVFTPID